MTRQRTIARCLEAADRDARHVWPILPMIPQVSLEPLTEALDILEHGTEARLLRKHYASLSAERRAELEQSK